MARVTYTLTQECRTGAFLNKTGGPRTQMNLHKKEFQRISFNVMVLK